MVNRVKQLFMVVIRQVFLKLKLSQVTHVADKENLDPMGDQVITVELEFSLCKLLSVVHI